MWLLSTSRGELKSFVSPADVVSKEGGFAILSHTWGDHEQSFQDVQAAIRKAGETGSNPRDFLSAKIRKCCELAEQEGYKWVWIDTCCIDKTSSAELSEAINSMYHYYSLATVCYVYLEDWHANDCIPVASFCECRWHSRGWTLQELIAPKAVAFYNSFWHPLGSKANITFELARATRLPHSLLRRELSISDFSIAQRMSWAAKRQTTRVEDEAYSLLGIFGVNMSTIYGEGRNAFRRLQEEIMRLNPDPTLYAWGPTVSLSPDDISKLASMAFMELVFETQYDLLASRPADFLYCDCIEYQQWAHGAPVRHWTLGDPNPAVPRFTLTPSGAHIARLRIAPLGSLLFLADILSHHGGRGQPLYLVFIRPSVRPRYIDMLKPRSSRMIERSNIGFTVPGDNIVYNHCRMVLLTSRAFEMQLKWREAEVNLAFQPSNEQAHRAVMVREFGIVAHDRKIPFCWSPGRMVSGYMSGDILVKTVDYNYFSRDRSIFMKMVCEGKGFCYEFLLVLCVCYKGRRWWLGGSAPAPFAVVHADTRVGPNRWLKMRHDCSRDHLSNWNGLAKQYALVDPASGGRYSITLNFVDRDSDGSVFGMIDLFVATQT